jgi:hypothetical protein
MNIETVENSDIDRWLELAREVEPLFGPMVGKIEFHEALEEVINEELYKKSSMVNIPAPIIFLCRIR